MLMTSSLLYENTTYMTIFSISTAFTPRQSLPWKLKRTTSFHSGHTHPEDSDNTISVRVYKKQTHTDQYLKLTSHHLARAKKSVITSLFDRAKNIISNPSDQEKEENHLTAVLQANFYPKKFINNTTRASHLPRQSANSDNTESQEPIAPVGINLPYVNGTSEQLKRIFNDHNINCTFYTSTTLRTLLSHEKDPVPSEQRNNIVYKYYCKDCEAVCFGESK